MFSRTVGFARSWLIAQRNGLVVAMARDSLRRRLAHAPGWGGKALLVGSNRRRTPSVGSPGCGEASVTLRYGWNQIPTFGILGIGKRGEPGDRLSWHVAGIAGAGSLSGESDFKRPAGLLIFVPGVRGAGGKGFPGGVGIWPGIAPGGAGVGRRGCQPRDPRVRRLAHRAERQARISMFSCCSLRWMRSLKELAVESSISVGPMQTSHDRSGEPAFSPATDTIRSGGAPWERTVCRRARSATWRCWLCAGMPAGVMDFLLGCRRAKRKTPDREISTSPGFQSRLRLPGRDRYNQKIGGRLSRLKRTGRRKTG